MRCYFDLALLSPVSKNVTTVFFTINSSTNEFRYRFTSKLHMCLRKSSGLPPPPSKIRQKVTKSLQNLTHSGRKVTKSFQKLTQSGIKGYQVTLEPNTVRQKRYQVTIKNLTQSGRNITKSLKALTQSGINISMQLTKDLNPVRKKPYLVPKGPNAVRQKRYQVTEGPNPVRQTHYQIPLDCSILFKINLYTSIVK